jgi:hypothetical protein
MGVAYNYIAFTTTALNRGMLVTYQTKAGPLVHSSESSANVSIVFGVFAFECRRRLTISVPSVFYSSFPLQRGTTVIVKDKNVH